MESHKDKKDNVFENHLLATFPTKYSYFDHMMQGERKSGYYSSGKIDFVKDFITFASNADEVPGLAAAFAYQLFHIYKNLIGQGILEKNAAFNVVECGAGNGNLCFHILETIHKMAQETAEWQSFYKAIIYNIVELSPALVKEQIKRTSEYKTKVNVIQGNALYLSDSLKEMEIAAAISNELPDMFPAHMVTLKEIAGKNVLCVHQILPFISENELEKHVKHEDFLALKEESEKYKKMLSDNIRDQHIKTKLQPYINSSDQILLSEKSFLDVHASISIGRYQSQFQFIEIEIVPVNVIPELKEFTERNPLFVSNMELDCTYMIENNILSYLQGINKKLLPGGEIITIDYFQDDVSIDSRFRTYQNLSVDYDIYAQPGYTDITKNVNSTIFVEEGLKLGLSCLFYGNQNGLSIDSFPETVLSSRLKQIYRERSELRAFRVLVQSKQPILDKESKATPIKLEKSDRFVKKSEPVSYADFALLKSTEYKIDSFGKVDIQISESDLFVMKTSRDDFTEKSANLLKKYYYCKERKLTFVTNQLGGKVSIEELLSTAKRYQFMADTLGKVCNKQLISEEEKTKAKVIFERMPVLKNYPTLISTKNIFTDTTSKHISDQLNELTKKLIDELKWQYYPVTEKRKTAEARLVSNGQQLIHSVVAYLKTLGVSVKPKTMKVNHSTVQYVVQLDEASILKLTGKLATSTTSVRFDKH